MGRSGSVFLIAVSLLNVSASHFQHHELQFRVDIHTVSRARHAVTSRIFMTRFWGELLLFLAYCAYFIRRRLGGETF